MPTSVCTLHSDTALSERAELVTNGKCHKFPCRKAVRQTLGKSGKILQLCMHESTTCCIRLHSIALHVVMKLSSSQNPDGVYVRQVLNNGLL